MNGDAFYLLALALVALVLFALLFETRAQLDEVNERLADARLRLWTFAELMHDQAQGYVVQPEQLRALFPEIVGGPPNPRDRKGGAA